MPSDGNDQVFISINAHGNGNTFLIGRDILLDEFTKALQFRCGEAILTVDACYSGHFIHWLNEFYENPNLLSIAGGMDIETTSMVGLEILKGLDSSLSVQEAFDRFVSVKTFYENPVMFSQSNEPLCWSMQYVTRELSAGLEPVRIILPSNIQGEDKPEDSGTFQARFLSRFNSSGGLALTGAIPWLFSPRN